MKQKELTGYDILLNIESESRRRNDVVEQVIVSVVSAITTYATCSFLLWLFYERAT